jgi:hypothetical protein
MAMDTMPSALDMSFRTALLLTGETRTAEVAVTRAIDACEALSPGGCRSKGHEGKWYTGYQYGPLEYSRVLHLQVEKHLPRANSFSRLDSITGE